MCTIGQRFMMPFICHAFLHCLHCQFQPHGGRVSWYPSFALHFFALCPAPFIHRRAEFLEANFSMHSSTIRTSMFWPQEGRILWCASFAMHFCIISTAHFVDMRAEFHDTIYLPWICLPHALPVLSTWGPSFMRPFICHAFLYHLHCQFCPHKSTVSSSILFAMHLPPALTLLSTQGQSFMRTLFYHAFL